MSLPLYIITSQYKVLPTSTAEDLTEYELRSATMLRNDTLSFQAVFKGTALSQPVTLSAECDDLPISAWRIDCVPVTSAANVRKERGYVSDSPGLYPDLLLPRSAVPELYYAPSSWAPSSAYYEKDEENLLNATSDGMKAVWFTVNPDGTELKAGEYTIRITLRTLSPLEIAAEAEIKLTVIDTLLPPQNVTYTNWFYCDMICKQYNVKPFTPEFYGYFRSYVKNAVRHRQNALLLPAFTPALDTKIGEERMCVQLVDVTRTEDGYRFGFDRMREFMRISGECGVQVFEHCHLFTQWGAEHAPAIYDTDGKKIFGWETDAAGDEYVGFIRAYLKAYFTFAENEGWLKRTFFHISDEPTEKNLPSYAKAVSAVRDLLDGFTVADALSEPRFYTEGYVQTPIASVSSAPNFDGVCLSPWLYYTGGPYAANCSNRLITNTPARTRVLGAQLFRYHATGFLHWGYNFYSDRLTSGWFDPASNPCGYKQMPGASFLAYPTKEGAAPSLREKLMGEAIDDNRALCLLEQKIGRNAVIALCEQYLGAPLDNHTIPEKNACFALRQAVNELLK